jgi:hypothetical protein
MFKRLFGGLGGLLGRLPLIKQCSGYIWAQEFSIIGRARWNFLSGLFEC